MTTGLTALQAQLEAAAIAVAELQHIGCRVLSVRCTQWDGRASVHIAEPGRLLDHLDRQRLDTGSLRFAQGSVEYRDCTVFWLVPGPLAGAAPRRAA